MYIIKPNFTPMEYILSLSGSQRDPIFYFSETRSRSTFDRRVQYHLSPPPLLKFSGTIGRGSLGAQGTRGDDLATLFDNHTFPYSGMRNAFDPPATPSI